eukprot:12046188-Prorocentrum_lima.AAC.1
MTSSLVGSEMCIRDSPFFACNRKHTAPHNAAGCDSPKNGTENGTVHSNCCLLYTSDAADDM